MDMFSEPWTARWERILPARPELAIDLLARYREPWRRYHDLDHLEDVLAAVSVVHDGVADIVAVELAAWFHDAVYDVHRHDNEDLSAQLAEGTLPGTGLDPALVAEVARLVRVTRTHDPAPDDANGAVLCDADLAVLGSDPARYVSYVAKVRAEYAHVDDDAFATGRAQVVRQLLGLPRLFRTTVGRQRWEATARANLHAELAAL